MPLKKQNQSVAILLFMLLVALPNVVLAKKLAGFVPPSYWVRFFRSLVTLAPVAVLLAAFSYFGSRQLDRVTCQARRYWFVGASILLTIGGAAWAARDGYNDELWSPHVTGSMFLSLLIPLALVILSKRWKTLVRLLVAALIVAPSWWVTAMIAMSWQFWGMSNGLPTTW